MRGPWHDLSKRRWLPANWRVSTFARSWMSGRPRTARLVWSWNTFRGTTWLRSSLTSGLCRFPARSKSCGRICRGLEIAHKERIIHRDLKPKNLILCRRSDGTDLVKIVDFGIAKLAGSDARAGTTTTGDTPGTPHYMSPEQARGDKDLDERTDVHAVGVIAYELLTGNKPHVGDSYNAIIYQILSKPSVPLREHRPEIPEGLERVVNRAMAKEPEERFPSARELERALAPYGPGAPSVLSNDDTTIGSGGPIARRRKRPSARWGWLAVASASVVAVATWMGLRSAPASVAPEVTSRTAPVREVSAAPPAPTVKVEPRPETSATRPAPAASMTAAPPLPSAPKRRVMRAAPSASPRAPGKVDWNNPYE